MSDPVVRFDDSDIDAVIPEEGDYRAFVHSVRQRTSQQGNSTIQVVYEVPEVDPAWDRVSEYFVIAGSNRRALAISRRRLHSLCRALRPRPWERRRGEPRPSRRVEIGIRIGHEIYDHRKRPRVLAHRPRA